MASISRRRTERSSAWAGAIANSETAQATINIWRQAPATREVISRSRSSAARRLGCRTIAHRRVQCRSRRRWLRQARARQRRDPHHGQSARPEFRALHPSLPLTLQHPIRRRWSSWFPRHPAPPYASTSRRDRKNRLSTIIVRIYDNGQILALLRRFFADHLATRLHLHFEAISRPWSGSSTTRRI